MSGKQDLKTDKWVSSRVQQKNTGKKSEDPAPPAKASKDPKDVSEVASHTGFERQEATDTLSNFSHYSNSASNLYQPVGTTRIAPAGDGASFHERFTETAKKVSK